MFHATAKALHNAAESRIDDTGLVLRAQVEGIDFAADALETQEFEIDALPLSAPIDALDPESLVQLHNEFRWAESKLMQASERLAEAQESRRKDLVALACMRRELRAGFATERAYAGAQAQLAGGRLPWLHERESALQELVDGGALTEPIIRELAAVRAERKLSQLAMAQTDSQIARIDEAEATLEYDVASETYDREPDGRSMRELARLRSESTRARRAAVRLRNEATARRAELGLDRAPGEITAVAAFLAGEHEGDARASERMTRLRSWVMGQELQSLPEPTSAWKAGLLHPVNFFRARRTSTPG